MKRTIIGVAILLSATLTDIGITIASAIMAAGLTEWNTKSGKYWTALTENGLVFPFILAKVLFVIAIVILLREYFDRARAGE